MRNILTSQVLTGKPSTFKLGLYLKVPTPRNILERFYDNAEFFSSFLKLFYEQDPYTKKQYGYTFHQEFKALAKSSNESPSTLAFATLYKDLKTRYYNIKLLR